MQERDLRAEARRRHQPLEHAAEALGRAASEAEPDRFARIATELAGLSEALAGHIRLTEGPDGVHSELIAIAPRLSNDIRLLAEDHDFMESMIESIGSALDAGPPDPSAVTDDVSRLLDRIERHRLHDAEMIYEAYQVDIGGQA